ncbi:unnamed protein product [Darwinula stevensoni]|uniref:STAS domain-containing protein n=1 Tax=Darwinula stevensoni TaxID=69355 RepID=A0A7R9FNV7_9CRUS|nr:unnamed protein product [Darwinula stevensoni]CAG0896891.1 unnamed protein product [Darwinula stevensoni]
MGTIYPDPMASILLEDYSKVPRPSCPCPPSRHGIAKTIQKKVPITKWLPRYNLTCLVSDLIAGLTVGLTILPQGLAYAAIANLPVQYGLYSAFMGCFVYLFVGSVKDVTVGPTAVVNVVLGQFVNVETFGDDFVKYAVLLCFLTGVVEVLLGITRLGFMMNFISTPVMSGFTSAAAIVTCVNQVTELFGLSSVVHAHNFVHIIRDVAYHFSETHMWDFLIAFVSICLLLFLRKARMWDLSKVIGNESVLSVVSKAVWFISTARNAIVMLLGAVVAYSVKGNGPTMPLSLTGLHDSFLSNGGIGNVVPGIPPFAVPPFVAEKDFLGKIWQLLPAIFIIPLVGILESIAVSKAFARGKAIDFNQEIFALGLCNLAGSFFSSVPTSGSLCRTVVNAASGVKTPAGGIVTGSLVLLALAVLTPYFYYIPKACLAAVIICTVIFMFEYKEFLKIWKVNRWELVPWLATFLPSILLGLHYGIMVGVGLDLVRLLFDVARPNVVLEKRQMEGHKYLVVKPEGSAMFPAVEHVRRVLIKRSGKNPDLPVIIDCEKLTSIDFTSAKMLDVTFSDLAERGQELVFIHGDDRVRMILQKKLGSHFHFYESYSDWITATFTPNCKPRLFLAISDSDQPEKEDAEIGLEGHLRAWRDRRGAHRQRRRFQMGFALIAFESEIQRLLFLSPSDEFSMK